MGWVGMSKMGFDLIEDENQYFKGEFTESKVKTDCERIIEEIEKKPKNAQKLSLKEAKKLVKREVGEVLMSPKSCTNNYIKYAIIYFHDFDNMSKYAVYDKKKELFWHLKKPVHIHKKISNKLMRLLGF